MTAFITRYCKKFNALWLAALLAFFAPAALAHGINVERAELIASDSGYQINADFDIALGREVEDAINKGVALHFLVEFVLMEPSKYWFDQEAASASLPIRLSYHALSRQYLLHVSTRQSTFATLQEAVEELRKIRSWMAIDKPSLDKISIKKDVPYYAMLRMRLDPNKLPKPLQVSAIGSESWDLISERHRWTPSLEKPEKPEKSEKETSK